MPSLSCRGVRGKVGSCEQDEDRFVTIEATRQSKSLSSSAQLFLPSADLDLGLHVLNGVARLHLKRDCLAGEGLDKDCGAEAQRLEGGSGCWRTGSGRCRCTASQSPNFPALQLTLHATAQAQHQVERALLLDVVVCQRAAVLKLLAREDQALLVRGDAYREFGPWKMTML